MTEEGSAFQRGFFRLLQMLPTEWASALGSFSTRLNVRMGRPEITAGASANLRRHKPDWSDARIERGVQDFLDNVGRFMAEFAVMDRFIAEKRLQATGVDAFKSIAGTRPIIAFGLHTGNWETFGPMFQEIGVPLTSFYAPPDDPFERAVAEMSRGRFGVELLSPDAAGAREGLRRLKANRVVMIFPDEARNGVIMGPLFGRAPHERGNLAIAARLARHSGASFVICHSRRVGACRFALDFSAPFELPVCEGRADVMADVAFLNGKIEPIILENIPRWYFLDDSLEQISI